jgi:hypothetical protein
MMTFSEAYTLYGPDVELIAQAMAIKPHEADRLISERMNRKYRARIENASIRDELRAIGAGRSG